jgi:outer membrane receptor protein involved in Fe transport
MRLLARTVIKRAALALCISLWATNLKGQTATTGTIEGAITDINGALVPGVLVTAKSPNLIRAQSATSNDHGRYSILNLPPGRYTLTTEAAGGFDRFEQRDVEVNLSKTATVLIELQPASVAAHITINASGALVDTTGNTSGTNVSTEQFSNITTQRTVQSLYTIAPGVTRSGLRDASGRARDPSVAGSSGPENAYILDGVNTADPVFGGSGANLPFEFVQEVEIKTGAWGAEYGLSTGGIFNVVTKSGGNSFHGDMFAYFTTKGMVGKARNFPFTGSVPEGFSEIDAGFDVGGPIKKNKLWFFGAFNPQRRENFLLTHAFFLPVSNRIMTPYYAGKLTYAPYRKHIVTFSTFADFTTVDGFRVNAVGTLGGAVPGFGADPKSFLGETQLGGHNYAVRLNSTFSPNWIGEFAFGAHFQRNNIIPPADLTNVERVRDNFAVVRDGAVLPVTDTNINFGAPTGFLAFVDGRGGTLERGYDRQGFSPPEIGDQARDRYELQARLVTIFGRHSFKYGFGFAQNRHRLNVYLTGPTRDFGSGVVYHGFSVLNNFGVCTVQGSNIVCPTAALTSRVTALIAAGQAPAEMTRATTNTSLTAAQLTNNPFLIRSNTNVADAKFSTNGQFLTTNVESFYLQDDFKVLSNLQLNFGLRWDYQQAAAGGSSYLKLNSFKDNAQPRLGLSWDFTGKGRGKAYVNFARFLEAPIPLSVNVIAGGHQAISSALVNRLNAPAGATVTVDQGFCCPASPIDSDLKPQTVNEVAAGVEYEVMRDLALGFRGVYRAQGSVIEDGSLDGGATLFLYNPGESESERLACASPLGCFGRARRYYRAMEFTATKRFTSNYQFIGSYVFSSLIGNYEGLYRNDTGEIFPNLTTLFDLQSLLANTYGRLPNDRRHQFKFDGSYRTPIKLLISGSFYAQSGAPFNQLVPHILYGNNESFAVPRGTAIIPSDAPGGIKAGANRTPATFQLDLGAYYPIKLAENRQLRLHVDWFNVTNAQRAIKLDESFAIGSGIPGANTIQFPNPAYGQGRIFQFPSTIRLGVKFQF